METIRFSVFFHGGIFSFRMGFLDPYVPHMDRKSGKRGLSLMQRGKGLETAVLLWARAWTTYGFNTARDFATFLNYPRSALDEFLATFFVGFTAFVMMIMIRVGVLVRVTVLNMIISWLTHSKCPFVAAVPSFYRRFQTAFFSHEYHGPPIYFILYFLMKGLSSCEGGSGMIWQFIGAAMF